MQRKPNGVVIYEPGEQIIKEGEKDKTIYFLISGKIGVYKSGKLIGIIDKPNSPVGEISAILGTERTATCIATERSQLVEYKGGIDEILSKYPKTAKMILVSLAERVAKSSQAVSLASEPSAAKGSSNEVLSRAEGSKDEANLSTNVTTQKSSPEFLNKLDRITEEDIPKILKVLSEKELSFILSKADGSLKAKLRKFISERKLKMIEDLITYYSKNHLSSAEYKILEDKIDDIVSAILEEKEMQSKGKNKI